MERIKCIFTPCYGKGERIIFNDIYPGSGDQCTGAADDIKSPGILEVTL
jgi:hypothetical protein